MSDAFAMGDADSADGAGASEGGDCSGCVWMRGAGDQPALFSSAGSAAERAVQSWRN